MVLFERPSHSRHISIFSYEEPLDLLPATGSGNQPAARLLLNQYRAVLFGTVKQIPTVDPLGHGRPPFIHAASPSRLNLNPFRITAFFPDRKHNPLQTFTPDPHISFKGGTVQYFQNFPGSTSGKAQHLSTGWGHFNPRVLRTTTPILSSFRNIEKFLYLDLSARSMEN